jgi:hypothetical protein
LFGVECRLEALVLQSFNPGNARGLMQPEMFTDCLDVDEQNLGRPAIVEQQQCVHAAMHRARRLAAHHPKEAPPVFGRVFGGENPSTHGERESWTEWLA